MTNTIKIRIVNCKNNYFWYFDQMRLPLEERKVYKARPCSHHRKGIVVRDVGYIYDGDYEILSDKQAEEILNEKQLKKKK